MGDLTIKPETFSRVNDGIHPTCATSNKLELQVHYILKVIDQGIYVKRPKKKASYVGAWLLL